MRVVSLIAGLLVAFLLGGYVDHTYDWPFGYLDAPSVSSNPAPKPPTPDASTVIPRYSNARGAEDAPRNDAPAGTATDMQRCVNTMVMRRESETEARTVCQKIISGIGG